MRKLKDGEQADNDEHLAKQLQNFYGDGAGPRRSTRTKILPARLVAELQPSADDEDEPPPPKKEKVAKKEKEVKKPSEPEISEYEKLILKNIEERKKLFEQFNIKQAKENLSAVSTPKPKKTTPAKGIRIKKEIAEPSPIRHSPRILARSLNPPKQEPIDYSEGVDGDLTVMKKKGGFSAIDERKPSTLTETYANGAEEGEDRNEVMAFIAKIKEDLNGIGTSKGMGPLTLDELKKSVSKYDVSEDHIARITKDRIYSMAVHPSESRRLVLAGDRKGHVGIWSVDETDDKQDGCRMFFPHREPVNCVSFDRYNPTKFYSTSYDGLVKRADLETGAFEPIYMTDPKHARRNWTSYHAQKDEHVFYIGQGDGDVAVIDTRSGNMEPELLANCYDISVKTVDIHPLQDSIIATSSRTGVVCLFDMRRVPSKGNRKLHAVASYDHSRVCHSAFFSPITGKYLLSSGGDDTIRIYDVKDQSNPEAVLSLKHNNFVGRWITPFRPVWHPQREDAFICGSMAGFTGSRQVDIFTSSGSTLHTLKGDWVGSILSVNQFHPTQPWMVGGNASGKAFVFE